MIWIVNVNIKEVNYYKYNANLAYNVCLNITNRSNRALIINIAAMENVRRKRVFTD